MSGRHRADAPTDVPTFIDHVNALDEREFRQFVDDLLGHPGEQARVEDILDRLGSTEIAYLLQRVLVDFGDPGGARPPSCSRRRRPPT